MTPDLLLRILLTGAGATLCMDLWALLLKRRFAISSLDYALVGRWFLGMFDGRWFHATIVTAPPRQGERKIGWILHYAIGLAFAFIPLGLAGIEWYAAPEPRIALLSGWLSLAAPFLVMQPALGFGVAAAKTANPRRARLLSLITHTVYGLGLLIAARLLATFCA
ncbi:permease [Serratia marcescens]|nr:permease [Serratia marcescens]